MIALLGEVLALSLLAGMVALFAAVLTAMVVDGERHSRCPRCGNEYAHRQCPGFEEEDAAKGLGHQEGWL